LALGIVLSVSSKRATEKIQEDEEPHPLEILSEAL
jgi:hypothetical protein